MKNTITYRRASIKLGTEPVVFEHDSIKPMTKADALRVLHQNGNTYSDIIILKVENEVTILRDKIYASYDRLVAVYEDQGWDSDKAHSMTELILIAKYGKEAIDKHFSYEAK